VAVKGLVLHTSEAVVEAQVRLVRTHPGQPPVLAALEVHTAFRDLLKLTEEEEAGRSVVVRVVQVVRVVVRVETEQQPWGVRRFWMRHTMEAAVEPLVQVRMGTVVEAEKDIRGS